MEGKISFVMYTDQREVFDELDDVTAGKLIKHIFSYVNDEDPIAEDLLLKVAFLPIKTQLKRDLKVWDQKKVQRAEAGRKGGLAKASNASEVLAKPIDATNDLANLAVNDNVNDNVNVNVNVNGNVNVISSITIFNTSRLGGKNLFEDMKHIYDLNEEQIQKLYQEWSLTHEDQTFESERHLKNSFILFVKNNASRFKQAKNTYRQKEEKPKSKNIFDEIYQDLKNEEELNKPK